MAVVFVLELDGVSKEQYEAVMAPGALDLPSPGNPDPGEKWPDGIIAHFAGPSESGWRVVDVWESEEAFGKFQAERLGAAMQVAQVAPPNFTTFELYNSHIA